MRRMAGCVLSLRLFTGIDGCGVTRSTATPAAARDRLSHVLPSDAPGFVGREVEGGATSAGRSQ
jgi:hypothetical protein